MNSTTMMMYMMVQQNLEAARQREAANKQMASQSQMDKILGSEARTRQEEAGDAEIENKKKKALENKKLGTRRLQIPMDAEATAPKAGAKPVTTAPRTGVKV